MEPEVISSDANFIAEDLDGFAFAVISSPAFITWQRTIGGRIKSDLRFNKLNVWNTFPLPELNDAQRDAIIAGGQAVLEARQQLEAGLIAAGSPKPSLADLYNPLAMNPTLLAAHRELDRAVDSVFGLRLNGSITPDANEKDLQPYSAHMRN